MRAITHITASALVAAGVSAGTGLLPAAGLFLFGGFLDIDHIRLFVSSGLPATPGSLIGCILRSEKQIEVAYHLKRRVPVSWTFPVLHNFELAALLIIAGFIFPSAILVWSGIGVLLHLMLDMWSYPCGLRFFSILWRSIARERLSRNWVSHRSRTNL